MALESDRRNICAADNQQLPTEAFRKLNLRCALFNTACSKCTKKALITSLLSLGIPLHNRCLPSTMLSHSFLTVSASSCALRRYSKRLRMAEEAVDSEGPEGIRRMRRERMSPMEGPPQTRMISEEEPPESLIGITKVEELPRERKAPTRALQPARRVSEGEGEASRDTDLFRRRGR